mgnify:CR=1 FL=1
MAKFAKQKKPIKFQTLPVVYEDEMFTLNLEITISIAPNVTDDEYTAVFAASLKSEFGKVRHEICFVALEELCDKFQPTHDPHIGKIKDLAAAAVLIASFGAGVIGIILFVPHLW